MQFTWWFHFSAPFCLANNNANVTSITSYWVCSQKIIIRGEELADEAKLVCMYSIEGAERSSSIESFVYRVIFSHQILKSESRIEAPICSMATIMTKKERTVNKFSCLCHFSKSLIKASNKIPFRKKRLVAFFSTP